MTGGSSTPPVTSTPAAAPATGAQAPAYYYGGTPVYAGVSTSGAVGGAGMGLPAGATPTPVTVPATPPQVNPAWKHASTAVTGIGDSLAASLRNTAVPQFSRSQGSGFQPVAVTFAPPTVQKANSIYG